MTQNFELRELNNLPMDAEGGSDSCDVYMELAVARDAPAIAKRCATLRFVASGLDVSLVGVPYSSLRTLARFIAKTVAEYESQSPPHEHS